MLQCDTTIRSRLWNALSRVFRKKKPFISRHTDGEIRLPPGLMIPPSKERASLFRKWHELENQARTTNNLRCYECRLPPCECRCRAFVYDLARYSRDR